jgi:hypothetical protein
MTRSREEMFDWAHLAEIWNLDIKDKYDDDEIEKKIVDYINNSLIFRNNIGYILDSGIKEDMIALLDNIIETNSYEAPILKGLKEVEDDLTFVQWYVRCLREFWV